MTGGLTQSIEIPTWKWEAINMDYYVALPNTQKLHDSISIIDYMITMFAHFIPVKSTYRAEDYAKLYVDDILRWNVIPLSIISDRGAHFNSHVWRSFKNSLGIEVKLNTTFHPKTDGQAEFTIHTLEDMLRACVIDFKGS